MKEKTLLKIALITSFFGLVVLFFVSNSISVDERNIGKITLDDLDEHVKVKGTVSGLIDTESVVIMNVLQPEEITVVLFKEGDINLQEGDKIEVIGKVEEYDGKVEVIGQKVRLIE